MDAETIHSEQEKVKALLRESSASPFLFLGAGFSRRYINLESWAELLEAFCKEIKDYHYYFSSCQGDLPAVATLMANDFHQMFWTTNVYEELRARVGARLKTSSSALKYAIAGYVERKSLNPQIEDGYQQELDALGKLNVDGIITTNWDNFLEQKFPDYKVYVGQEDLFYTTTQGVCEIYKIHGCVKQPETLVLTTEDYKKFKEKNAYLAAKLTTIFLEHPIIFMGYSLQDPNITELLCAMANCLGSNISLLQNNLIFVEWQKGQTFSVEKSSMIIGQSMTIPITLLKTDSFLPIFDALSETKRKIPAKILRYCKENIYNLVSKSKEDVRGNISVVDLEDVEDMDDIEFYVGVGIKPKLEIAEQGYHPITAKEIYRDILFDDGKFQAENLIKDTIIPHLIKGRKYLPVFKYLRNLLITNEASFNFSNYTDIKKFVDCRDYKCKAYSRTFVASAVNCTVQEIIDNFDPLHTIVFLAYAKIPDEHIALLEEFLKNNFEEYYDNENSILQQEFRKLICRFDRLKFGW